MLACAEAESVDASPRSSVGSLIRLGLRAGCAAAILAVLFHVIPLAGLRAAIVHVQLLPLLGAFILALAAQSLVALRLTALLRRQGIPVAPTEMLGVNLGTLFYGLFLPGGNVSGAVIRCWSIVRQRGGHIAVAASLLLDRLLATWALCVVGLVAWSLAGPLETWPLFATLGAATALLSAVTGMALTGWALPAGASRYLSAKLPKHLDSLRGLVALPRSAVASLVALSLASQVLGIAAYACVGMALDLDVGWLALAWARSGAMLAVLLPISVSGLGVREAAIVLLLAPYGVSTVDALAFALLVFGSTTVALGLLGGLLEAWRALLHLRRSASRQEA